MTNDKTKPDAISSPGQTPRDLSKPGVPTDRQTQLKKGIEPGAPRQPDENVAERRPLFRN